MSVNHLQKIILAGLLATGCADAVESSGAMQECKDAASPYYCPAESLCCLGQCVINSDENCGACGKSCRENEICAQLPTHEWACVCAADHSQCSLTCCSSGCVEISTNSHHCGQCGNACPEGQICSRGICQCTGHLIQCGNACVDLSSDSENCGNCGNECPDADDLSLHLSYSSCVNASCSFGCLEGYSNLDGNKENGCEATAYVCGNSILDPNEECDQSTFGNQNCKTMLGTGYTGVLKCNEDCTIDTSSCTHTSAPITETPICGNGKIEEGEVCDQNNLNNHRCEDQPGYTGGTLKCSDDCHTFVWDDCVAEEKPVCGNGKLEGDEKCDKTAFLSNINTCAAYDSRYISGNLSCTTNCKIDTSNCSECVSGQVKCANQVLKKCTGKTWETTECKGATPICSAEAGKCIAQEPTQTTYSTDFEWLPDAKKSDIGYEASYEMPNSVGFALTATGRIYLLNATSDGTDDYKIDGKGIILRSNDRPASGIAVTELTNGIGTIEFDVYGWDQARVYIEHGNATSTETVEYQEAKPKTRTHVEFEIHSPTDTMFTIKSFKRVTVDNLSWTSAK
ncbi:MAG: hypothetical protein IJU23_12935 [Proteobacteria bacterium]|nr:hypothetical protein [Pseudomonadota bacterium]